MTNAEIIALMNRSLGGGFVHPCANDSQYHAPLKAVEEDGQVVLVCDDCDYRQVVEASILEFLQRVRNAPASAWNPS